MKKLVLAASLLVLMSVVAFSYNAAPQAPAEQSNPLVDYGRQLQLENLNLIIVHMNNKTVDVLFQAPQKYAMRARANLTTMFYIQGRPTEDVQFSTAFSVLQGDQEIPAKAHSLSNFVDGTVKAGERIDGILELPQKVDISQPFGLKHGDQIVDFTFTPELVAALGQ